MWHVWERREIYACIWWGNPKERGHLEDKGVDRTIILKMVLEEIA